MLELFNTIDAVKENRFGGFDLIMTSENSYFSCKFFYLGVYVPSFGKFIGKKFYLFL